MKFCLFFVLCVSFFVGCSSLQENIVSIEQTSEADEIFSIENRLAFIDSAYLLGSDVSEAKVLSAQIDEILKKKTLEAASVARLYALKGRLLAILGENAKASQCLEKSQAAYKGDVQSYVLSMRLGLSSSDFVAATAEDESLLALEDAIKAYLSHLYLDSAAKFDSAFLNLPDFYGEAYKNVRDTAWSLREVAESADDTELKLLLKEKLSVSELVLLSKLSVNTEFMNNLDKKMSEKELFKLITAKGLLSPASALPNTEAKPIESDEIATRIILARYLWNIFCEIKAKDGMKTQYSSLYRAANEESPVADVPIDSADFDAVLGVVENELLSLTDGENFAGNEAVEPTEAASSFKKLK